MSICSTAGQDLPKTSTGAPKRCLTVNEWCEAYSLSRSTFYALVANGELRTIRLAGRTLITIDEAEAYLARAVSRQSGVKPAA
jgi:excisionase family DNA binding protein